MDHCKQTLIFMLVIGYLLVKIKKNVDHQINFLFFLLNNQIII